MAKCFSKKYGNNGRAFKYLHSEYKLCQNACQRLCYIPTSLPQEQAVKSNMVSVVRIQVFVLFTAEEGVRCLSAPDATSLHHCLKNKQLNLIWFLW